MAVVRHCEIGWQWWQLPAERGGSRPPSSKAEVININMKKHSSSKKKRPLFVDDKSGEQTATPRVKKSYSVTNANYLQLQLDTSAKKRQTMQRNIQIKDKRIRDLEKEVRQQQEYITQFACKYKDIRHKWEHERQKGQRLHLELQQAVDLCKSMKDKCRELMDSNQDLAKAEKVAREKLEFEEKRVKELKELRRKEKAELRRLIIPLLQGYSGQGSLPPEDLAKVSKVL